jgi:cell division protein ZapA
MNEQQLKVKIGNREYPVRVKETERAGIERAVEMVQKKVSLYEKNYPNTDMQDLLAMVLLQTATQLGSCEKQLKEYRQDTERRLLQAEEYLTKSLS